MPKIGSWRWFSFIAWAAVQTTSGLSAQEIPAVVTEEMSALEIAARLMAGSARASVTGTIEEEWGNEELSCTPVELRGAFYDAGEEVIRRPRLRLEVNFAFGSASIASESGSVLNTLAEALSDPGVEKDRFLLVGHTDAVGSNEDNQSLSQDRARAVRNYLIQAGIPPERLQMVGCGERSLLDKSDPRSPVNRRVEIINAG